VPPAGPHLRAVRRGGPDPRGAAASEGPDARRQRSGPGGWVGAFLSACECENVRMLRWLCSVTKLSCREPNRRGLVGMPADGRGGGRQCRRRGAWRGSQIFVRGGGRSVRQRPCCSACLGPAAAGRLARQGVAVGHRGEQAEWWVPLMAAVGALDGGCGRQQAAACLLAPAAMPHLLPQSFSLE
jgi:hypothetical protein